MIKTVIFDIGNVLMTFSWWPHIGKIFDPETADAVTEAIWRRGNWNELDRGLPVEEVIRLCQKAVPGYDKDIRKAFSEVGHCCHRTDYAIPWIRELKERGYRVLFLSNYSHFLIEAAPEVLDFLPELDGGVFSSDVKRIKPDPAIYACICEKYGLNPSECLFIDDNAANIAAAAEFGLNTVHFTGYPEGRQQVDAILKEQGDYHGKI